MDNETLATLKDSIHSERSNHRQIWDAAERYVLPFSGDFYKRNSTETSLELFKSRRIYDTTGVMGAQLLAADLHANMSSDATKWNKYQFKSQKSRDNTEKVKWLEECSDLCNQAIRESNFSLEVSDMYLNLVAYGPATITLEAKDEKNWDGLAFRGIALKESYWVEGARTGRPGVFMRSFDMTPYQIKDKWGDDIPQSIKDKAETAEGYIQREQVIFAIYRRDKFTEDTGKHINPELREYAFKYFLYSSKENLGKEGGYYSMPVYIPRWRRMVDSQYGYSPTTLAMGNILTAQEILEQELTAAGKAVDPTILVNEGNLWGDLNLGQGAVTVVNDINGIRVLESGMRLDIADHLLEQEREQIRNFYYTNYIQLKESPAMTAYETAQRIRQTQRFLGPTYGRLTNDLFDPMLNDVFWIMSRAGQLPTPPESVATDKDEFEIEYIGPLALAQKGQTSEAIKMYLQGMAGISELYPEARDIVNIDKAARRIAELDGVPIDIMNDDGDVKKVREARREQQAKAQQIEMARAAGEAGQAVAGAEQMGVELG